MRKPAFQTGETNWGLSPITATDVASQVLDAVTDCYWYFIAHPREGRRLSRAVARLGQVRLSIGCGRTLIPGWIGIDRRGGADVYQCDLRRPLPLPDGSVDVILAEHALEHFPFDDLPAMLRDYRRVLRPGGAIRIVSPEAAVVADLVHRRRNERVEQQMRLDDHMYRWDDQASRRILSANRLTHQYGEHKSLLSAEVMQDLLAAAGFSGGQELTADSTAYLGAAPDAHFKRFPDSKLEAFVVEAVRPAKSEGLTR